MKKEVLVAGSWTHWLVVSLGRSSGVSPVVIHPSAPWVELIMDYLLLHMYTPCSYLCWKHFTGTHKYEATLISRHLHYNQRSTGNNPSFQGGIHFPLDPFFKKKQKNKKHFSIIVTKSPPKVGEIKPVLPADITPWSHVSCDARVSRKVLNPESGVGHEGLSGFHKNRLLTSQSSWHGALSLTVISSTQIKNSCSHVFSPA